MNSSAKLKKSALRKISITRHELRQLLFWAKTGATAKKWKGGTYFPEILETIRELESKLSSRKG